MTKAILVMDMPSCCNICIFNNAIGECKFVGNVDEALSRSLRYVECPLKPLKENYISIDWLKQNIPFQHEDDGNILLSMLESWNKHE